MNPLANPLASIQPLPPQQQMAASKRQGANPLLDWVGNADQQTAPMSNKTARRGNPLGDAMPMMSAEGPAAPTQGSPISGMPYGMGRQAKESNPLGAAFGSFARGFLGPERTGQIDAQHAERENAKLTKTLTWLQQTAAQPAEQRVAFTQRFAQQIAADTGQPVEAIMASLQDPNGFSDQSIQQGIAALSAQLDQAPEQPEYMNLGGGNVGMTRGGEFSMVREAPGEPQAPIKMGDDVLLDPVTFEPLYQAPQEPEQPEYTTETFDGAVWAVDKRDPTKRTRLGAAPQGTQANAPETYRSLSPDEVAARGYSPGTVVQVDSRGREYVNARPSTAQTGQPTEGERNAGMHVGVSLNGLQNITNMEGRGYNRAGVGEQFSTLWGENEKLYDQAAAEFIDGYLRAMTGAAATATEIDTYRKQWFPQFGDNEAVVKQKAAGRLNAIQSMKSKAGRAWNPAWDSIIDQLAAQVGGAANNIAPPPSTPASAADLGDDDLRAILGLD